MASSHRPSSLNEILPSLPQVQPTPFICISSSFIGDAYQRHWLWLLWQQSAYVLRPQCGSSDPIRSWFATQLEFNSIHFRFRFDSYSPSNPTHMWPTRPVNNQIRPTTSLFSCHSTRPAIRFGSALLAENIPVSSPDWLFGCSSAIRSLIQAIFEAYHWVRDLAPPPWDKHTEIKCDP